MILDEYINNCMPVSYTHLLLDPRTGKEATDLNRIAELNPNQHDLNILWSIHNDNRAAITTPVSYTHLDVYKRQIIPVMQKWRKRLGQICFPAWNILRLHLSI